MLQINNILVPKAPDDYAATTIQLTFLPGVNLQCASISIIDDAVLESNEDFTVQLTAQETAAITINLNSTGVTIADNDGEIYLLVCILWNSVPLCLVDKVSSH